MTVLVGLFLAKWLPWVIFMLHMVSTIIGWIAKGFCEQVSPCGGWGGGGDKETATVTL